MKILITGGAGFIGSHLTEELVQAGNEVTILDNLSNGCMSNLKNVEKDIQMLKLDISFPLTTIKRHIGKIDFDQIYHLACYPRSLSFVDPDRDLMVNARGTLNVLELARANNAKIVFTSNSGIYGEPQYLPIDEKHPDAPSTPYDANKLVSEYYLKVFNKEHGIKSAICRLATVYGPRQRTSPQWKPIVAEFVDKILSGKKPTINWDGLQTRDLIFVKDIVAGLQKAMNSDISDGTVCILGTGVETSIKEIYDAVCELTKMEPGYEKGNKYPGDLRRMRYNSEKAKKLLEFEAKYTVSDGIKQYIAWYSTEGKEE